MRDNENLQLQTTSKVSHEPDLVQKIYRINKFFLYFRTLYKKMKIKYQSY